MQAYLDILSELSFLMVVWAWLRDRRIYAHRPAVGEERNEIIRSILEAEKC